MEVTRATRRTSSRDQLRWIASPAYSRKSAFGELRFRLSQVKIRRSFLVGDLVICAHPLDACEAMLSKMHTGDQKSFPTDNIQQSRSRRSSEITILVECNRNIRPRDLDIGEMDDVAPDQHALATALKAIAGMPCRMTGERNSRHAGKHFAGLKGAQPVTISVKRPTGEMEVALGAFGRATEIASSCQNAISC